ncbi:MAG TPA: hypothetical protein VH186_34960, partial [Chloroflexia bacterium]|nr:hypothetical protein [Chloroflexia bacterium]
FSYSLYLMHAPVLMVMTLIAVQLDLFSVPAYLFLVCAGIPAAVFFSYLFHLAFERRFMSGVSKKPAAADPALEPAVAANQ